MKKAFVIILVILSFFTIMPVFAVEMADIAGVYEGWYYANQGQTGLSLTIYTDGTGEFEFYNMPGKSNAKDGKYTVSITVSGDTVKVVGKEWIEKPSGYSFVSLKGTVENDNFFGQVNENKNWEFILTKNNESYQQISDSVFANNRYQIFDEELTWVEAKSKCEEMGGHLVTITSQEEQEFVQTLLENGQKRQYWIGLKTDGDVAWVTGEEYSFSNWDKGEPNGNRRSDGEREHYVHIYNVANPAVSGSKRFKWNDMYIDNTYPKEENNFSMATVGYICEWETWTNSSQWSTPELQKAAEYNLIPDVLIAKDMTKPITRGEFAAVAVNLFEAMTGGKAIMSSECKFKDIGENENRNYILKAYNIGAVVGYSEDEYGPNDFLQREQLATMLCRVYKRTQWPDWTIATDDKYTINYSGVVKFEDDDLISDYAKPSVYFLVKYGVLSGVDSNKFAPKNTTPAEESMLYANATREQAIAMSLRSFENLKD